MIIKRSHIIDDTNNVFTAMYKEIDKLTHTKGIYNYENKTFHQLHDEIKRLRIEYINNWDGKTTLTRGLSCKQIVKCIYCGSNKTHLERCDSCGANIDK